MATLRVRNIDDRLYEFLRETAKRRHRSISRKPYIFLKIIFHNPNILKKVIPF